MFTPQINKEAENWMFLRNKWSWITLAVLALTFLFELYMPFIMHLSSEYYFKPKLNNFATIYTSNISTDMEKLSTLFEWQRNNYWDIYGYINDVPLVPFIYRNGLDVELCMRTDKDNDPTWVFFSKCGGCGESAMLYSELVKAIGFDVRIIKNSGEDHAWTEVFVNDSWITIDPSWDGGFNSTRENLGYKRDVSYVYALHNGLREVVTEEYTNKTGKLKISLNGESKNPQINLISEHPDINRETEAKCDWENNSCELILGARNYTLIVIDGGIIKRYDKQEFSMKEGEVLEITFNPNKLYFAHWVRSKGYFAVLLLLFVFFFWGCIGIAYTVIKNTPKRNKLDNKNGQKAN